MSKIECLVASGAGKGKSLTMYMVAGQLSLSKKVIYVTDEQRCELSFFNRMKVLGWHFNYKNILLVDTREAMRLHNFDEQFALIIDFSFDINALEALFSNPLREETYMTSQLSRNNAYDDTHGNSTLYTAYKKNAGIRGGCWNI